ncbi:Putative flavin monooxygenase, FAD/NAD(P)-binding domain superfamily [Septoria linicola]|uniref:Flavin monooxygenase, FAD/NAD(P)-binding domain superfamily n=1 Tax=Septoria linicola TaxID=215465 RepID=A0A9Q9AZA5_9PEZI|nr:putative flavin monooxygenase, FAD/NAD(P)-binding domain superfamily [Septoria linicola]USW55270.1 Putative flavin monooxygenase, FAD/NAD(P)-binding domain superfamily [Septoria linicola]
MTAQPDYEGVAVGTGFGGLYALYLLKQLGLKVRGIESAPDVGGTWYWNRYPGARSDVTSDTYRYSNVFDNELLLTHDWPHNYLTQPELQSYFQAVARKHELYPLISFNSDLKAAHWDDEDGFWKLEISTGEKFTTRYLVTSIGILHKPKIPDIPGLDTFKGQITHSSKWTPEIEWEGKRVAVIGSGASGVQLTSALAEKAKELTQFIRHAQYVLPAQLRPVSPDERKSINDKYDKIWEDVWNSAVGFGFDEPARPALSVSAEERHKIFQDLWDQGSGFRFLFGGFSDLATDEAANKEAINFIHNKIKETVKDLKKAEVLLSNDWFARRPLTDDNYYERFNQDNVHAVDITKNPIVSVVPEGIKTADGQLHEFDLIVFATGFDSVDGSYFRIDFRGLHNTSLPTHWSLGPHSHTGATTSLFPNLFFVNGPGVPFANNPPVTEESARFAADLIARAEEKRKDGSGRFKGIVESTQEADEKWLETMRVVAGQTLFARTGSWFFGENVEGRVKSPRFYFGGIGNWRREMKRVKEEGYEGFVFR